MGDNLYDYPREQVKREIVQLRDKQHLSYERISKEIEDLVGRKLTRQEICRIYRGEKEASQKEFIKSLEVRKVARLLATGHSKREVVRLTNANGKGPSLYVVDNIIRDNPEEVREAETWAQTTVNQMLAEGRSLNEIRLALSIGDIEPKEPWLMETVANQWMFVAQDMGMDSREAILTLYKLTGDIKYTRAVGKRLGVPINIKRLSKGIV